MKVLVTGHDGYIGAVLAPMLVEAGHEVVGLDALFYKGCDFGAEGRDPVPAIVADVRDVAAERLEGFDAVVHLAGLSNDPLGALDPRLTAEVNTRATVRLARAAKQVGVGRFLFASSCSMYGVTEGDRPIAENAQLRPLTDYARSKVQAEEGLLSLADEGFSPVLMRNATVYGVSPRLRIDLVLNNLVAWAVTTGCIRIMSDGTPWRPLVHVRDVASATLALLEAPRELVHAEAFNVGRDDENFRVRELAEIARLAVGDCDLEVVGTGDPDNRSYRVDFGKLRRTLPALSLSWTAELGARELAAAYKAVELTYEEFDGPRYIRLKRLQELLADGALDDELRRTARV